MPASAACVRRCAPPALLAGAARPPSVVRGGGGQRELTREVRVHRALAGEAAPDGEEQVVIVGEMSISPTFARSVVSVLSWCAGS